MGNQKIVTGIDLSAGMLAAFREKYPDKTLTLIQGSYFDVPFGEGVYDGAVSVESLHHFTKEEKIPLYTKLHRALKPGGYLILTDYFSLSQEEEQSHRAQFLQLKAQQGLTDGGFYHFDTPLTLENEMDALKTAGFSRITLLDRCGATCMLKAER